MKKCAVVGDPVAHSLSPVLHRAAYAALGLSWTYDAVRVSGGRLRRFLDPLDHSWRGLSLTMPLKREAMALATSVSQTAALVGAANTLVLRYGEVHAHNTDLPGAAAAVRERYAGPVTTGTVLGAGATAASTGLALCDLGATSITILARSPERAAETSAAVAGHPSRPRVAVGALDTDRPTGEVVVSTIPATAQTTELVERCAGVPVVFEVLYDPWPTPLAASVGERILVGGLDLLVQQAALQVEAFTGLPAPLERMREAGQAALAERSGRAR